MDSNICLSSYKNNHTKRGESKQYFCDITFCLKAKDERKEIVTHLPPYKQFRTIYLQNVVVFFIGFYV